MPKNMFTKPTQLFIFTPTFTSASNQSIFIMSAIQFRDINHGNGYGVRPMFLAQHDDFNSEGCEYQWVDTIL
jgi:hypothetical protein